MIRINDYLSIEFAQWVSKRQYFNNLNSLNDNKINELVEIYLKENAQRWNLRLFLKLFQDYIIRFDNISIDPRDLTTTFEDFCISMKSLKFIDPNSIDKRVYLYPLLQNFCTYVNIRTSNHVDNELKRIASISYKNREGVLEWFNEVTKSYSEDLFHLFRDYMQNLLSYDFEMFSTWVYKNQKQSTYSEPTNYDNLSFDYRKYQIIREIKNGIVDDNIQLRIKSRKERTMIEQNITLAKGYSPLDFVHYLEKRSINIFRQVPKEILESLAYDYVSQYPDVNKKIIYDFIREMEDTKTFSGRFTDRFRNKYGNKFSFERYCSCKYHGVFLFRKNDNLSKFLRNFWHDIHVGTGDIVDFYFTDQDIKSDYHCKLWMAKYTNMEIDVKEFPSIFLWQIGSINKNHILLKGLSHEEIFDVIEYLTAQLESTLFSQSILVTNTKIKQIIESKRAIYNNYIVKNSQIGAFGKNATSNNNTFGK